MKYSNRLLKPFIFIISLFIFASDIQAATYYVSPTGSGTSCTYENSCLLNTGLGKLIPGDILYLRGGTYPQTVSFGSSGTLSSRINISGYQNEQVIIDGGNTMPSGCYDFLFKSTGSFVTIQNLTVTNSHGGGIAVGGTASHLINISMINSGETGVVLTGTGNIADHLTVTGSGNRYDSGSCTTWGSALSTVGTDSIIKNSLSYGNRGEGLNAYSTSRGAIIEDNISYNNKSCGIYIDSTSGTLVRRNLVYYTPDYYNRGGISIGAETGQSQNTTIVNNFVYGAWINFAVSSTTLGLINTIIANNTFVDSQKTDADISRGYDMSIYFRPQTFNSTNSYFQNNIVLEEDSRQVPIRVVSSHPGLTFSNNLWSKTPVPAASGIGDAIGDPKLSKVGQIGAGLFTAEWFKLLPDSPAIDKALVLSEVTDDYFRAIRGISPDVGAHEYISQASSPSPTPSAIPCFGADNIINSDDVRVWADNFLTSLASFDVIKDNKINTLEFGYLVSRWGNGCGH